MDKKGAEMTIGTIVVIILALVVLVVIIYGFTVGWGNLWDKIFPGEVNVQTVIQHCQVACASHATYDYCSLQRDILFSEGAEIQAITCISLESRGVGLEKCNNVDCDSVSTSGKSCSDWSGTWSEGSCSSGYVDIVDEDILSQSDKNNNLNKHCCVAEKTSCSQWSAENENCANGQYDITFLINASGKEGHTNQKCCVA